MQYLSICMNKQATEPVSYGVLVPLQIFYIYPNYVLDFKSLRGLRDTGGLSKLH